MMICCLNPDCPSPENTGEHEFCQSCGTPLVRSLRNRYRVIKVLSDEGGFGRTYLAKDIDKLNETCVVKQLAPKIEGTWGLTKAVELFKEEAKLLQELGDHPQIPTLLAYFEEEKHLYVVQQFISGQNLWQELEKQGSYSEIEIRNFLLDLLPVLKYVHQHGVIHRDIKPQNIIRRLPLPSRSPVDNNGASTAKGDLVLIDFGASKQLTARVQTKPGTTIGSHGYSPIEQIRNGEAYAASDLFSLGATCFHLLTQINPFQLWTEYGYSWVSDWQQYLNTPLNPELAQVLDKLLKKDLEDRYQSAEDVLVDLELLTTSPLVAPSQPALTSTPHQATTTTFTPPRPAALPGMPTQPIQPPQPLPLSSSVPEPLSASASSLPAPVKQQQGQWLFAGVATVVLGIILTLFWQLNHHQQVNRLQENRDSHSRAATSLGNFSAVSTLQGHSDGVMAIALSEDGTTIASGSADKSIKIWNPATGKQIHTLTGHTQAVQSVAFSPDGKTLASASVDKTIKLWDLVTKREIRTIAGHKADVYSVAFSPNGQILASGSLDRSIKLWDLATGQNIRTLDGHTNAVSAVVYSPDGKLLASASVDGTVIIWDAATGIKIRTLKTDSSALYALAFSPDGTTIASAGQDSDSIQLWNVISGKVSRSLKGHAGLINAVAFSPDGRILASGSVDESIKLWNLQTGSQLNTLTGHAGSVNTLTFSPDGKTLISGSKDKNLKIWRVAP